MTMNATAPFLIVWVVHISKTLTRLASGFHQNPAIPATNLGPKSHPHPRLGIRNGSISFTIPFSSRSNDRLSCTASACSPNSRVFSAVRE